MGKRMQNRSDCPWEQSGVLTVLCVCFLFGGAAGLILAHSHGLSGADALRDYLTDYLLLAADGELTFRFWPVVWDRLTFCVFLLLLGGTFLGVAGLPALCVERGFFLGFCCGCFCRVFGRVGAVPAFVLFGLPALLWVPGLMLACVSGVGSAWNAWRGSGRRGAEQWSCASFFLVIMFLCVLLELWAVPVLLRAAAKITL